MIRKSALCSFLFFSIGLFSGLGQNRNFKNWSVPDGLPQSNVYTICQDSRNFIWIGTASGAAKFDGKTFWALDKNNGLNGNIVRAIAEDHWNRVWFGTNEGITIYDGMKFLYLNKSNGLKGSSVLSLFEDDKGNMWAGTDDGGINLITFTGKESFRIVNFNDQNQLSDNSVFGICQDKNGNIWVATLNGGINILVPVNKNYLVRQLSSPEIPTDMLLTSYADKQGNIWFGTYDKGLFYIKNPAVSEKVFEIVTPDIPMVNDESVWKIIQTEKDEIWFSTGKSGIWRLYNNKRIEHYSAENGLNSNQILALLEDEENHIWIGSNGNGISLYTGDYFSHYNKEDRLPDANIQDLVVDSLNQIWMATDGGGLVVMKNNQDGNELKKFGLKEGLPTDFLTSVAIGKANNQNVWIGTLNEGVLKFNGKSFIQYTTNDGLANNRVNCLYVDKFGILWIGTADGISRFDGKRFLNLSTDNLKMSSEGVNSIAEDGQGNLWFGTAGGLVRYARNGVIRTFDEVEGLKNKAVNSLAVDLRNNIYLGTNGGLYFFDSSKPDSIAISKLFLPNNLKSSLIYALHFINEANLLVGTNLGFSLLNTEIKGQEKIYREFDKSDGFIGVECNLNAVTQDKAGNIWIGTSKGLTKFSIDKLPKKSHPPALYLNSIQLFYEDIKWEKRFDSLSAWNLLPKRLELNFWENNLSFVFNAISFINPGKVLYKYKLIGQDDKWSPLQDQTIARFSGLSHGQYTFCVLAKDVNGNWSEQLSYSFVIYPPWYLTKWAIGGGVLSVLLLIVFVVKLRERQLKKEKRILEGVVEERTIEVVKQKNEIEHQKNEIIDSITYAQRIQFAILPTMENIQCVFPESFVLFKPKDIVAGDFYWMKSAGDCHFIAAADCTGHGVPGAMVSVVCSNALNTAVNELKLVDTGLILDKTKEIVVGTFEKSNQEVKDGMDISLLRIRQYENNFFEIQWSGANNSLLFVEGKELKEIKPTKQSISKTYETLSFVTHQIDLAEPAMFYLITDGYADQFGKNGKKFMKKRLRELLENIHHLEPEIQKRELDMTIIEWMDGVEQTDDISIIGIRLTSTYHPIRSI